MTPTTDKNERMEGEQRNQNLYLDPHFLIPNEANEKARPGETAEMKAARVAEMAKSIAQNGQEMPVLVVEKNDDGLVTYEYVDGGCRVEAIGKLNDDPTVDGVLKVWCSLVPESADLFRTAVTTNFHRTQNSPLEMALIIKETKERNKWNSRGASSKVAEYLGLLPSRVSEYEKLLKASDDVKAKVKSGEIGSLDAALKLMSVPAEKREQVVERAQEIAKEEQSDSGVEDQSVGGDSRSADMGSREKHKNAAQANKPARKPPTVKAKHVAKAAREVANKISPRSRTEIIDLFVGLTDSHYPPLVKVFANYFTKVWTAGKGSDTECYKLLDAAVGVKAPKKVKKAISKDKTKAYKSAKPKSTKK